MNCNDKKKFRTSEASSKASLRTKGAIDKFLNILDTNLFRKYNKQWSQDARERFNISGSLFYEENNKAIPNKEAFQTIDKAKKQQSGTQHQLESNLMPTIGDSVPFIMPNGDNITVKVVEETNDMYTVEFPDGTKEEISPMELGFDSWETSKGLKRADTIKKSIWEDVSKNFQSIKYNIDNLKNSKFNNIYNKIKNGQEVVSKDFTNIEEFKEFVDLFKFTYKGKELPLLYHGSQSLFSSFKEEFLGKYTGAPSAKQAFFAAKDLHTASAYGEVYSTVVGDRDTLDGNEYVVHQQNKNRNITTNFIDADSLISKNKSFKNSVESTEGGINNEINTNIYPLFFISDNTLISNVKGDRKNIGSISKVLKDAKEENYDSVIFKDIYDGGFGGNTDVYTIFSSKQILNIFDLINGQSKALQNNENSLFSSKFNKKEDVYFNLNSSPEIQFDFKISNIISGNLAKIRQWESNKSISQELLYNKIQQLGVPKEQLELLKNSNGNTIEEKLINLLANYSYTVEINTTKNNNLNDYNDLQLELGNSLWVIVNDEIIDAWNNDDNVYTLENAPDEIKEYFTNFKNNNINTAYYSNLTVPGGTNYTENEIATPAITPSIKGHAEFATDNGIGWFRSDEQAVLEENLLNNLPDAFQVDFSSGKFEYRKENNNWNLYKLEKNKFVLFNKNEPIEEVKEAYSKAYDAKNIVTNKTRRILEVQSDLFQKGRDKKLLSKEEFILSNGKKVYPKYSGKIDMFNPSSVNNEKLVLEYEGKEYTNFSFVENKQDIEKLKIWSKNLPGNQFLQLLNKNNNWVTFFVKSIIQDSAKKGYEKILFPTGNTASKVEGHSTLEEFKKQKEDRIKELENKLNNQRELEAEAMQDMAEEYRDYATQEEQGFNYIARVKEGINIEINQLKQELERVEGPGGFGALKPIYNFYENTVTNILNKTYGKENVKQITDEYGNTWNEVTINPNRDNVVIYLQNKLNENKPVSPKMLKFVKEFIKQNGVDYQKVDKIVVNGKVVDANGIARMMSKLIQVVEGKESVALPEEAMHFAVEIIEQTNPKLFEQMLKDINGEAVYQQVNIDYGKNPYYQKDGKPDIRKLKKEAIGKLLVDKVSSIKAQTWWDKIVKFLKELFNKPQMDGVDSLTQFAEMIVSGEDFGNVNDIKSTGDYFQLNEQDKVFNKLKDLDNQITKEDDGVNDNGDPKQSYFIGEKKIKHRVTDFVSDWYKKIFKGEQTEYQKRLAELKAEEGTKGHYHFEKAFDTFVDPNTGLLREDFLEDDDQYLSTLSQVDKDIYATLKENLRDRLLSFSEGSKFLKEARIYDGRETAGTVDLLIVEPSGKVSIIDWKFIDINTDKYEDVPWYKVKAWNLQMEKYRGILTKNYGVKEEDFKQTRMIPILAMYTDADHQGQNLPKLRGIKIGSVNAQNVNEDYLLYVGFKERTGDEKIDNLLDKMNSVYSKISNEKVSPQDRALKNEQLNSLYKAIRHLEIKKDIIPLVNQGKVLNKQVSNFIKKYNDNIKNKSKEELGKETINEFAGMIRMHMEALQPYLDIRQLKYLLDETDPEFSEIKSKLRDTVEDVQDYLDQLESIDKEFGKKFVGASYTAEKVVKGITRWFGNAATIQLENLQRLFTLANEATAISNFEVSDEVRRLEKLRDNFTNWANAKGLPMKDYFKIIIKPNKNELINQYDSNFYKELKTAIAKKDFRWILDNVDKVEVIKKIKEQEEREIDAALNYPIVGSEEHVKSEINKKIAKIKDKYDVSTSTSKGWLQEQFIKIPTGKWESKEWKELHEKDSSGNYVNQPAIDFYNYIVEKNKLYKEIGYLTGKSSRTFLPWIRKGFLEGVMLDGKPQGSLDQFLRNISVDENETAYGQIDPVTGKVIDTIPIHFVNQLEGEYSTDLFSTMFLYNEFAIKYKNLSQIEEQARLLLRAEQNKQSIMTSIFGNVIKKGESFDYNNDNLENTKLYESFMKSIIYQQKYINNEEFDIMLGKISGFGKKFNDKLGMKIFPEDMESRYLTVNKTLDQMNRAFQLQALGLNALSSISNMFGGTANAMINAGKYFTKDDYLKTQAKFLWEKLQGDENAGKILAAVDYFAPFVDSYNRDAKKKLSLMKLTPEGIQDFLMIGLRKGDEMIQYMNAFTFIKNMIVVDGQVKNVREYLRSTDEYKDFYAGNAEQRKARKEKFEEDVNKLIEEKGLLNVSKLSENGTLEIPGIERKSDSIIEQRRIIQQFTSDALGSLTEENRRLINMNVYGSSLMVFKNWIPRLVDVRVGGLKYNAAYQAYEWGRYRTFYSMLIPDILKTIKSLTGAVTGNSDVWLEQVRQMFEKQKEEYFNSTGKELKMTESEFISLVNQNIKNQALDLMILTTLLAIGTVAKAMAPDDDEDENVKNVYRFMLKATDKVTDEVSYFYNPMTPFNLISTKGVFPSVGILNNYAKFLWDFLRENYGIIVKDDELIDDAKPIKYLMKSFPVSSQAASYLPMFYPELAKDLGIRMQSTYGVR